MTCELPGESPNGKIRFGKLSTGPKAVRYVIAFRSKLILFYLPAYSPELNPIEQLFAKLKSMLRK